MKDLAIKSVVTSKDGFYYREEHEWKSLASDKTSDAWWKAKFDDIVKVLNKFATTGGDDGLQAELGITIDGAALAGMTIKVISYSELHAYQRYWHRLQDELLSIGESRAHDADKKRGWGKHGNRMHAHLQGK